MMGRRARVLLLGLWAVVGLAGTARAGEDGSPRLAHDFFPGEFEPDAALEQLTRVGETAFFLGKQELIDQARLWRTSAGGIEKVGIAGRSERAGDVHAIVTPFGRRLLWTLRAEEEPATEILLSAAAQGDAIPLHTYRPRKKDVIAIVQDRFFFQDCAPEGCKVWSTDGTVEQTRPVATVNARFSSALLQVAGSFADRWLLLKADHDLFAYDVQADRFQLLLPAYAQRAEVYPRGESLFFLVQPRRAHQKARVFASRLAAPRAVQVFGDFMIEVAGFRAGRMYFSSSRGRLWSTDGTASGTRSYSGLQGDLYNFSQLSGQLGAMGTKTLIPMRGYYFGGLLGVDEEKRELRMLKRLCGNKYSCSGLILSPVILVGGKAFQGAGSRLLQTDGTREGTRLDEIFSRVNPGSLVGVGDKLLLGAADRSGVDQLWETDGTPAGTRALSDGTASDPFHVLGPALPLAEGLAVFADRQPEGNQLWRVANQRATALTAFQHLARGVNPNRALDLGGRVLFQGGEGWLTLLEDGSIERLPPFNDNCDLFQEPCPQSRTKIGPRALFATYDGELWSTDGTAAGSSFIPLTHSDGALFEVAALGRLGGLALILDGGGFLFTSDGTVANTRRIARLGVEPGTEFTVVGPPVPLGGITYLFLRVPPRDGSAANDSLEVWRTDGTEAGTIRLASTPFSQNFANRLTPVTVSGKLFFRFGGTLWMSDGSVAGTHPLPSQLPGGTFTLAAGTATLYAGAGYQDEDLEHESLWALDPQTFEARLLGTFSRVSTGGVGADLGSLVGDTLLFSVAERSSNTVTWWVTEGTAATTHPVSEFLGRPPEGFRTVGNRRYYKGCDAERGCELWSADRLGEDRRRVADLWPGRGSADPRILDVEGNTIWFAATEPSVGYELWRLEVDSVH